MAHLPSTQSLVSFWKEILSQPQTPDLNQIPKPPSLDPALLSLLASHIPLVPAATSDAVLSPRLTSLHELHRILSPSSSSPEIEQTDIFSSKGLLKVLLEMRLQTVEDTVWVQRVDQMREGVEESTRALAALNRVLGGQGSGVGSGVAGEVTFAQVERALEEVEAMLLEGGIGKVADVAQMMGITQNDLEETEEAGMGVSIDSNTEKHHRSSEGFEEGLPLNEEEAERLLLKKLQILKQLQSN